MIYIIIHIYIHIEGLVLRSLEQQPVDDRRSTDLFIWSVPTTAQVRPETKGAESNKKTGAWD